VAASDALTFILRGRDEFSSVLDKLVKEVKNVGQGFKTAGEVATKGFDAAGRTLKSIGEKAGKIAKKIGDAFKSAFAVAKKAAAAATAGIAVGIGAVTVAVGAATKAAAAFDNAMREVWTLTDWSTEQFADWKREVLDFSTEYADMPVTVAQGFYSLISASRAGKDQFDVLTASADLAVAGLSDMDSTMGLVVSGLNAFKWESNRASEMADLLFTTIKEGQTRVQWLEQYLPKVFGPMATLEMDPRHGLAAFATITAALGEKMNPTAVTALANSMSKLATLKSPIATKDNPLSAFQKAMQGIEEADFPGKIRKLKSALDTLPNAQAKFNALMEEMGDKRAALAMGILIKNFDMFEDKLASFADSTGAAGEAAQKVKSGLTYQMKMLHSNVIALATGIGEVFLPVISRVVTKVSDWTKELAKIDFKSIWDGLLTGGNESIPKVKELFAYIKDEFLSGLDTETATGSFVHALFMSVEKIAGTIWAPLQTEFEVAVERMMDTLRTGFLNVMADVAEAMAEAPGARFLGFTKETAEELRRKATVPRGVGLAKEQARELKRQAAWDKFAEDMKDIPAFVAAEWQHMTAEVDEGLAGLKTRLDAFKTETARAGELARMSEITPEEMGAARELLGPSEVGEIFPSEFPEASRLLGTAEQQVAGLDGVRGGFIEFAGKQYEIEGKQLTAINDLVAAIENVSERQGELEVEVGSLVVNAETLRETSKRRRNVPAPA